MHRYFARTFDVALSWQVLASTVFVGGYALLVRSLGFGEGAPNEVTSFDSFILDGTVRALLLAPIWLLASVIWVVRDNQREVVQRVGSSRRWFWRQLARAAAELPLVFVPLIIGGLLFAIGSPTQGSPVGVGDVVTIIAELALIGLCLIASRAVLAAVALMTRSTILLGFLAVVFWISGATAVTGVPLNSFFGIVSWATWSAPSLSGEVFNRPWAGLALFSTLVLISGAAVALHELGYRRWWANRRAALVPVVIWVGIAVQLLVLELYSAFASPVTLADAIVVLYQGLQPDQVGIPLAPFFLSLLIYFTPIFLMLARLNDELGGWMPLVLIRSRSNKTWSTSFLTKWVSICGATLLAALGSAGVAWILLPTDALGSIGDPSQLLLALTRYLGVGALQLVTYVLISFVVVWVTRSAMVGLGTVTTLIVLGVTNPLIGQLAPAYLNSLSRNAAGWPGIARDSIVLAIWAGLCLATLSITIWIQDRSRQKKVAS